MMKLDQIGNNLVLGSSMLRTWGIVAVAISVSLGLLVWFVIPAACSAVGGLWLLFLGLLFIAGVMSFALGRILLLFKRS